MRYWDGSQWTEHVSSHGKQSVDPPVGVGAVPTLARKTEKVVADVAKAGVAATGAVGGGTIFTEPVLVVNQKAKLIEVNNEYAIYDTKIGRASCRERECKYVYISVVAVSVKKKKNI